jgi:hypothetical protein
MGPCYKASNDRLLMTTELQMMLKEIIVSEISYKPCIFLRILCKITKKVGIGCLQA